MVLEQIYFHFSLAFFVFSAKKREKSEKSAQLDGKRAEKTQLESRLKALQQQIGAKNRDVTRLQDVETKSQLQYNNTKYVH